MDNYTALEWLYKQLKKKRVALGNAESKPNVNGGEIEDIEYAIETIEWIIAVVLEKGGKIPSDVVEVVRCKDCKHATFYSCKNDACYKGIICEYRIGIDDENFYCTYGERKEA